MSRRDDGRLRADFFRQKHKFWLARASGLLSPLLRLWRRLAAGRPSDPDEWRNIVLMGADHIGDVLYRTVGLAELKAALPQARLHFVASRPAAELLETHPALDSVIIAAHSQGKRSRSERVQLLRRSGADAVFCYDTGDYWKDAVATVQAGVPNYIGYVHKGFGGLVTRPLPFIFPKSYSESFRYSIESLIGKPVAKDLRPVVHLTPEDVETGLRFAQKNGGAGRMLAVGITGNQPQGEPLKERMMETLTALQREVEFTPVFLGAEGDLADLTERVRRWGLDGPVLCGELRLRECVAFLKHARAAFVVDSGLRHMANAADIPVIYFRNLYTFREETGSYLASEFDLAPDVECLSREVLATRPPLFEVAQGVAALRDVLERPSMA